MTSTDLQPTGDTERALLGALLANPSELAAIKRLLRPEDFGVHRHGWIYAAILNVSSEGTPLDVYTVAAQLQTKGRLSDIGGVDYLTSLANDGLVTSLYAEAYARDLANLAAQDKLRKIAGTVATSAAKGTAAIDEIIINTINELDALLERRRPAGDTCSTWHEMEERLGPLEWAWKPWLPKGLLTIIAGEGEAGKSILALRISLVFTQGLAWPDGTSLDGDRSHVLWCEAESFQAGHLERLSHWGYPTDGFLSPLADGLEDVQLNNPKHQQKIRAAALRNDVGLIVVDSLSGSKRTAQADSAEAVVSFWLADLAKETGKPVILVHHLRKRGLLDLGDNLISLDRVRGSSAICQPARVIWGVDSPDPAQPEWKRVYPTKNSLHKRPEAWGFQWSEDASGRSSILFCEAPRPPGNETLEDKAGDLLKSLLAKGPKAATDLQREIEDAGLSWDAAKRAKKGLGIVAKREAGRWWWALPVR